MNTIAEIVVPRTDGKYQSPEQISMRAGTPTTANKSSSTHKRDIGNIRFIHNSKVSAMRYVFNSIVSSFSRYFKFVGHIYRIFALFFYKIYHKTFGH